MVLSFWFLFFWTFCFVKKWSKAPFWTFFNFFVLFLVFLLIGVTPWYFVLNKRCESILVLLDVCNLLKGSCFQIWEKTEKRNLDFPEKCAIWGVYWVQATVLHHLKRSCFAGWDFWRVPTFLIGIRTAGFRTECEKKSSGERFRSFPLYPWII